LMVALIVRGVEDRRVAVRVPARVSQPRVMRRIGHLRTQHQTLRKNRLECGTDQQTIATRSRLRERRDMRQSNEAKCSTRPRCQLAGHVNSTHRTRSFISRRDIQSLEWSGAASTERWVQCSSPRIHRTAAWT